MKGTGLANLTAWGCGLILSSVIVLLATCAVSFSQTGIDSTSNQNVSNDKTQQLLNAARSNDVETARLLLAKGVNVNAKDTNGATALFKAVYRGNMEVARFLLANGADVNALADDGVTPLMTAASRDQTDAAALLLEKGADINVKNKYDWTPLMEAACCGYTNTVRLLLDKGADINARNNNGWTPLMGAVSFDHADTVKLLLDRGADENLVAPHDITAQSLALIEDQTNVIELLNSRSGVAAHAAIPSGIQWQLAQTNTDSSGYVTNAALLQPFTLTNSSGNLVTDAVLVKLTPNKFVYKSGFAF